MDDFISRQAAIALIENESKKIMKNRRKYENNNHLRIPRNRENNLSIQ